MKNKRLPISFTFKRNLLSVSGIDEAKITPICTNSSRNMAVAFCSFMIREKWSFFSPAIEKYGFEFTKNPQRHLAYDQLLLASYTVFIRWKSKL